MCASVATAQSITGTVFNQGVSRGYELHLPQSYNGIDQLPVVFVLHGGNSDGATFMSNSYFDEIGDTASFIAVFPDAYLGQWADGRGVTQAEAEGIDDVAFLSALIDTLDALYAVDTCRSYLTGISNGGMMTHRVACEQPQLFSAYASIASSISTTYYPMCQPSGFANMLVMHGTEDNFAPYEGGASGVPSSTGTVTGIDSTIGFWATHNQCTNLNSPDSLVFPDIEPLDNGYVVRFDFGPCNPMGEVVLYKVYGGGHTLPGGPGPIQVPFVGYSNKDINGAYEIWQFFSDKTCDFSTGNNRPNTAPEFLLYPNPVTGYLKIETNEEVLAISVFRPNGQLCGTQSGSTADVSALEPGVYFLRVEFKHGNAVAMARFIKM